MSNISQTLKIYIFSVCEIQHNKHEQVINMANLRKANACFGFWPTCDGLSS